MKKLIAFIIALLTIAFASAFTYNQITAPAEFYTSSSLEVNISGGINISAFPYLKTTGNNATSHVINVTILNKSSSSGSYGILANSLSLTINASNYTEQKFWNYTATLTEGYNWIRLNFTNVSRNDDGSFGGSLTAERIVNVDTKAFMITVGQFDTINISTKEGDINISGKYKSTKNNMTFTTLSGTVVYCGVDDSKVWTCS